MGMAGYVRDALERQKKKDEEDKAQQDYRAGERQDLSNTPSIAERALQAMKTGEHQDLGPSAQDLYRSGERQQEPSHPTSPFAVAQPQQQQVGLTSPRVDTSTPGLAGSQTYQDTVSSRSPEPEHQTPSWMTSSYQPGYLPPGQQGPMAAGQQRQSEQPSFLHSGINLAGIVPPTGHSMLDQMLGLIQPDERQQIMDSYRQGEREQDKSTPEWMKWVQDRFGDYTDYFKKTVDPAFITGAAQNIGNYVTNSPNWQIAQGRSEDRWKEIESGTFADNLEKWRNVGDELMRSPNAGAQIVGGILWTMNQPALQKPRAFATDVLDYGSEVGLVPATSPINTLLNAWRPPEEVSQMQEGPSVAQGVASIGAGFNRAYNGFNPNQNTKLWGPTSDASIFGTQLSGALGLQGQDSAAAAAAGALKETAPIYSDARTSLAQQAAGGQGTDYIHQWMPWLDDIPIIGSAFENKMESMTPDERDKALNEGLRQLGLDPKLQQPNTNNWLGKFFNAGVWAGQNAIDEFNAITKANETINSTAKTDPDYAVFKRNVWSGAEKMMNGYNEAFNRQDTIGALYETYLQQVEQGRPDLAAATYLHMSELADKSFSQIASENQNGWAEVGAGVLFDLGPFGRGGDALGELIREGFKMGRLAKQEKIYTKTADAALQTIELYTRKAEEFVTGVKMADSRKEVADLWRTMTSGWTAEGTAKGTVGTALEKMGKQIPGVRLTNEAQAELATDQLLFDTTRIFANIETKEDALRVMQWLQKDPSVLVTNGLSGLTSPSIRAVSPEGLMSWGPGLNMSKAVHEGPGLIGNSNFAKHYGVFKLAENELLNMDSLKGVGALNKEEFVAELAGILYGGSKDAAGAKLQMLPKGAHDLRVVTVGDGMARYEYVNKKGGRIFASNVMPEADARSFVKDVKQATGRGSAGEMVWNAVTFLPRLQKRLLTDVYLTMRPANWIRNSISGSVMTSALDVYGQARQADMDNWFMNVSGYEDPLLSARKITTGESAMPSGIVHPIVQKIFGRNSAADKLITGIENISRGESYWLGTRRPLGEEAFHDQAHYKAARDSLQTLWGRYVSGVGETLNRQGLNPQIVDQFLPGLYEAGITGGSKGVNKYIADFQQTKRFKIGITALGLPDDVLNSSTYTAISNAVKKYGPEQADQAAREIRAALQAQKRSAFDLLNQAPKQTGDFEWMKGKVPNLAEKMADLRRRSLIRQGVDPLTATQQAGQTADKFLSAHAESFDRFREALRQAPNTPNSWAVASDYYSESSRLQAAANKQVDDLARSARAGGITWDAKDAKTVAIYETLNRDLVSLSGRYSQVLEGVKQGRTYIPTKRGWTELLQRQAEENPRWLENMRGVNVRGVDDPNYQAKISAWRSHVDNAEAQVFESFKQFPTMDNFDMLVQMKKENAMIGQSAALKAMDARKRLGQKGAAGLSLDGYYNITNNLWEQAFGYMGANAQAHSRAMVANSIINHVDASLQFDLKGQRYVLWRPADAESWYVLSMKNGAVKTLKEEQLPPGLTQTWGQVNAGQARQVQPAIDKVVAAAHAAVPAPDATLMPRVNPPTTPVRVARKAKLGPTIVDAEGDISLPGRKGLTQPVGSAPPAVGDTISWKQMDRQWPDYGSEKTGRVTGISKDVNGKTFYKIEGSNAAVPADRLIGIESMRPDYQGVSPARGAPASALGQPMPGTSSSYTFDPRKGLDDAQLEAIYGPLFGEADDYAQGVQTSRMEPTRREQEYGRLFSEANTKNYIPEEERYAAPGKYIEGPAPDPYSGVFDQPGKHETYSGLYGAADELARARKLTEPRVVDPNNLYKQAPTPQSYEDWWAQASDERAVQGLATRMKEFQYSDLFSEADLRPPHNVWKPPPLGRKKIWGEAGVPITQIYFDENGDTLMRMKLKDGAKLLPPGVPSLDAQYGNWTAEGKDLWYVIPLDNSADDITPGGLRNNRDDVMQDVQSLIAGRAYDLNGRHPGNNDYVWWKTEGNSPVTTDIYSPTAFDGKYYEVKPNQKIGEVRTVLQPPDYTEAMRPKSFDNLLTRWQLPEPVNRKHIIVKGTEDGAELSFYEMKPGWTDLELHVVKQGDGYVVITPRGTLASKNVHPSADAAIAEGKILMHDGIGIGLDGTVVTYGGSARKYLPEFANTELGRKSSRMYLKGKTPAQILETPFTDDYGVTKTGREILNIAGVPDAHLDALAVQGDKARPSILSAIERALGFRFQKSGDINEPAFFMSGLPIPPEIMAMFDGSFEDGVKGLTNSIMEGIGLSQKGQPYKTLNMSDIAAHNIDSLDDIEELLLHPENLKKLLTGGGEGIANDQIRTMLGTLGDAAGQFGTALSSSLMNAQDMANLAMIDFRKQRDADKILGLFAPFSFWATRMVGRAMLASVLKPSLVGLYYKLQKGIAAENAQTPGLISAEKDSVRIPGTDVRWNPRNITDLVPGLYLLPDSFAKPDDFSTTDSALNAAISNTVPLGALQKFMVDYLTMGGEYAVAHASVGDLLPQAKWYSLAQMAMTGDLPKASYWSGMDTMDEGRIDRAINANIGVGTENEAYARAAAAYAYEGKQAPEGAIPQAGMDLYHKEVRQTGSEMFWQVVGAYAGFTYGKQDDERRASEVAVDDRQAMQYTYNPAGSRAATKMYDERTQNEGKDYMSYVGGYNHKVTADEALNRAQYDDYNKRMRAIGDKYSAEQDQWILDHPNATKQEYNKYIQGDMLKRKQQEEDDLATALPYAANYKFDEGIDAFKAENPAELQVAAYREAQHQAIDDLTAQGVTKPEDAADGSTFEQIRIAGAAKDTYNAKVDEIAQSYVNNQGWVQQRLGGRNPQTGEIMPTTPGQQPPTTQQPQSLRPTIRTQTPAFSDSQEKAFTPDPRNKWADKMAEQEDLYGLPSGMLQSFAAHESGFDPTADSGAAKGLMQFTAPTWKGVAGALGLTDINDPEQSIEAAAYYLNQINNGLPADKKNDPAWMAAAYNIGPGAVANMTDLSDITTYSKGKGYKDAEAREKYARDIGAEVSGSTPATSTAPIQSPVADVSQMTTPKYVNPNWGDKVGKWTVVGDPITDTGIQWVMPLAGDPEVYQYYGETNVDNLGAYYASKNQGFGHEGVDFMQPEGTHVMSIADGKVIFAGDGKNDGRPAYGNMIVVEHANGMKSRYGHLSAFNVQEGDTVTAGQYIGDVGHTPLTANIGDHLHLSVENPGEYTGPFNTIDPFRLIGQGESAPVQQMAQAPVTGTKGIASAIPPTTAPATQGTVNDQGIYVPPPVQGLPQTAKSMPSVPTSAEEYRTMQNDTYRTPVQKQAQAGFDAQTQAGLDYAKQLLPKYFDLYAEYDAILLDKDRQAYRSQHPEVTAVSMALHNPDKVSEVERMFGPGATLMYSHIPASVFNGGQEGERTAFYQDHPDAFLVKAWVDGRPEVGTDEAPSPDNVKDKNWGADYQEAEKMFGTDIWNTVRQYQMLPDDGSLESRKARAVWHDANPTFDAWNDWWYAKLPDTFPDKQQYNAGRFFGGGYPMPNGRSWAPDATFRGLDWQRSRPAELARARRNTGNSLGDWRKYFSK